MPNKVFIGGTDESFNLGANWLPTGVPANGDTVFGTDESQRSCTIGMTQAGKALGVVCERGFKFAFGLTGTPLLPDTFTTIVYSATSIIPSFFKAALSGGTAQVMIDTASALKNLVNLDGTILRLNVRQGSGQLLTTAIVTQAINVKGGQGNALAELTVPDGVDLTGCDLTVSGGTLDVAADCESVRVNAGEFILNGGADLTTILEVYDSGTFTWKAANSSTPSTITLAELYGGLMRTLKPRVGRTLTNANMYGNANVDFEQGGHLISIPNGIKRFGANAPLFTKGATYTVTF